jgi:ferritin-like metal-binding protein YciE
LPVTTSLTLKEHAVELSSLTKLFKDQIRDLYSAETQLTKALPRLAKKAKSPELKKAFADHLEETEGHLERLQTIGQEMEIKLGGKKCKAMAGLVEEGAEFLSADGEDPVIDSALIAAAQRVEHYEISAYGTARARAEQLGQSRIAGLLQQTLDEEEATDKKLTEISEGGLLQAAAEAGAESEV